MKAERNKTGGKSSSGNLHQNLKKQNVADVENLK